MSFKEVHLKPSGFLALITMIMIAFIAVPVHLVSFFIFAVIGVMLAVVIWLAHHEGKKSD